MAFELEFEAFKWRWEPNFLGYQTSSSILSKQLIIPLISTNHLAFSSSESLGVVTDRDLEKVIYFISWLPRSFNLKNAVGGR